MAMIIWPIELMNIMRSCIIKEVGERFWVKKRDTTIVHSSVFNFNFFKINYNYFKN